MLHPRGGVHFLRHDERLRIEIERHRSVRARCRRDRLHFPFCRIQTGNLIHHGLQMFGRRPTAAAHDAHTIVRDEVFVELGQLLWLELVQGTAADVFRQTRVG